MIGKVTSPNVQVWSSLKAAETPAARKHEATPAAVGAPPAHARDKRAVAKFAMATLGALIQAQARAADHAHHGRSDDAHQAHKKPKKPHPHDPPPAPPPPTTPPPAPPPVVVDDPAPAQFLSRVLETIREKPESQFPDVPFSKRDDPPPAPPPQGLSAFYTPGAFTPVQASAMRQVSQAQAGLALLQASQMSLYSAAAASRPSPFRINAFA